MSTSKVNFLAASGGLLLLILLTGAIVLGSGCIRRGIPPGTSPSPPPSPPVSYSPPASSTPPASSMPGLSPQVTSTSGSTGNIQMVGLHLVADGLSAPIALKPSPDRSNRLFVADQAGIIYILKEDGLIEQPFLDLRSKLVPLNPGFDERGLLGMALHPRFEGNGRFFVYYSIPLRPGGQEDWDHTSRLSEFTVLASDVNAADISSERVILEVDQPTIYHHAGQIEFGPDGYLYIPVGDGRPWDNGQDINTLLGKILRIDVDRGDPYASPPDNPFVGQDGRDEIFALGFRNPFRISFDPGGNGDLFAADAGENLWEEVNIVVNGGNYGWNIKEGTDCFNPADTLEPLEQCSGMDAAGRSLIDPIVKYPHTATPDGVFGSAVIGGFIYRGSAIPELDGQYVFGDYLAAAEGEGATGRLFVATRPPSGGDVWNARELRVLERETGRIDSFILSFGQDAQNELYVLAAENPGPSGNSGRIYKIVP